MARNTLTLRSVGAVVAGLIAIVVLATAVDIVLHEAGFYPPWGEPMNDVHAAVATAYRIAISIFGCWLAARLAPARPLRHAIILGVVVMLVVRPLFRQFFHTGRATVAASTITSE